jgi:hypothetical protein
VSAYSSFDACLNGGSALISVRQRRIKGNDPPPSGTAWSAGRQTCRVPSIYRLRPGDNVQGEPNRT